MYGPLPFDLILYPVIGSEDRESELGETTRTREMDDNSNCGCVQADNRLLVEMCFPTPHLFIPQIFPSPPRLLRQIFLISIRFCRISLEVDEVKKKKKKSIFTLTTFTKHDFMIRWSKDCNNFT